MLTESKKISAMKALDNFLYAFSSESNKITKILNYEFYKDAVEMVLGAEEKGNRIHVTGIGKPGHVAGYIASLYSSVGIPAYTLHGTEAVHGSSGQVCPGDVVIVISNSGETEELKATVKALKNNEAKIIAVTGNKQSWLAKNGDIILFAGVELEGDVLNRAPRVSILIENLVLQGLSIILQDIKNLSLNDYIKWHPSGKLGKVETL